MSADTASTRLVDIETSHPVWDRFFTVAPLVLIGTNDPDGSPDLAPKHMVTPMGWQNYFGFVCTPAHCTCRNIQQTNGFTVSYPKPSQVLLSSLAASPRQDGHKPRERILRCGLRVQRDIHCHLPFVFEVDAPLIEEAYLYFECRHHKTVDGFGSNCLITGEIIAAYAEPGFLRSSEIDDQELVHHSPLFAYLAPGRFAAIERSNSFPFPANMKK